jgi:2OG-Fe(II) oxygenase superfamily
MIRITRSGTRVSARRGALARLRRRFERDHYVRLRHVLDADLVDVVLRGVDESEFHDRVHPGIGSNKELCLEKSRVVALLHLLVNGDELFAAVREITGCRPIGSFGGRVYRTVPGSDHHDAWHTDAVGGHRLVAMSINLSPAGYRGGALQIRERASARVLCEIRNTGLGDAILFRIRGDLEHRITDVDGKAPKTAFAGWFQSKPAFTSLLKRARL